MSNTLDDDDDCRPVKPCWAELVGLVEGGEQRGYSSSQLSRMRQALPTIWTKASRRAEAAKAAGGPLPAPPAEGEFARQMKGALLEGWTAAQLEYFRAFLGLVWVKAVWWTWHGGLLEQLEAKKRGETWAREARSSGPSIPSTPQSAAKPSQKPAKTATPRSKRNAVAGRPGVARRQEAPAR